MYIYIYMYICVYICIYTFAIRCIQDTLVLLRDLLDFSSRSFPFSLSLSLALSLSCYLSLSLSRFPVIFLSPSLIRNIIRVKLTTECTVGSTDQRQYRAYMGLSYTGLPQTDPIPRQAPPPRSYEPQSQRKTLSAHSLKNTSLVGHHPQTFEILHSA